MTKRIQPCKSCHPNLTGVRLPPAGKFTKRRGWTRHDNGVCSECRRHGPPDPYPNRLLGRAGD